QFPARRTDCSKKLFLPGRHSHRSARSCIVSTFAYDDPFTFARRTRTLLQRRAVDFFCARRRIHLPFLAASGTCPAHHPALQKRRGLPSLSHWPANRRFCLGSPTAGQGDSSAAASRPCPCPGFLGVLRLCPGHAEPLRHALRLSLSQPRGCRPLLFL